jgi:hypothetical protein
VKVGCRDDFSELLLLDFFKTTIKPHAVWAEIEAAAFGITRLYETVAANNLLASITIVFVLHNIFAVGARHHNSRRYGRRKYMSFLRRHGR